MNESIGLIDIYGYVGAIEAADKALKAANVQLIGIEKVTGGIVTVQISGDVASVNASMEVAVKACEKFGCYISHTVIAKTSEEAFDKLIPNKQVKIVISEEFKKQEINQNHIADNDKKIYKDLSQRDIEMMKVTDLRKLAREIQVSTMTRKEIKFGKKDVLIENIVRHLKGRVNSADN